MANIDKSYFEVKDNKSTEIKDILTEDEEVLLELKPQKKVYLIEAFLRGLPIALLWAAVDTFMIIMMVWSGFFESASYAVIFVIIFFLIHLIPVWIYIAQIAHRIAGYKNLSYAFTDKRIIIRSGIIGIDFKSIYYTDISGVTVKVGILDKLFKVGDLYIYSSTKTAVLDDINAPYQYASKIQDLIRDLKADTYYPNDLRPNENHGYNTKYKK